MLELEPRRRPRRSRGLPPNYELTWNHTTLRALRVDPRITYLQVRYPSEGALGRDQADPRPLRRRGPRASRGHPLQRPDRVRRPAAGAFTTEARLNEIIAEHEAMGAMIFNPHRYTLEEGGMKQTDAIQLAFKRETDPKGLLNPGKMIAWENPDFDFSAGKNFLFPGLEARARAAQG